MILFLITIFIFFIYNIYILAFTVLPTVAPVPRFLYCPQNQMILTKGSYVVVWWRDPIVGPVGNGTQGAVEGVATSDIVPGSNLPLGVTKITYIAKNADGLASFCIFYIDIRRAGTINMAKNIHFGS